MNVQYPGAFLAVFSVVVIVALVSAGTTSTTAFGTYNPDWDGASELREMASNEEVAFEGATNVSTYDRVDAGTTVAIVLSPTRPYSATEAAHVRAFVRNGGTLVVAEDVGPYGNALLQSVNADARFVGSPLRDERYHAESPSFPVARNVTDHPLTGGVNALTLNFGTAVRPGPATTLVSSSAYAYLDRAGNERPDRSETVAAYPVATVESVGEGRVVAVGDPSVFINAMIDRPGNRQFARNLLAGTDRLLLDNSHVDRAVPPLVALVQTIRASAAVRVVVGLVGLALVGFWTRYPGIGGRRSVHGESSPPSEFRRSDGDLDREALARVVAEQHPEWDADRVRAVIAGIMHRPHKTDRDD